MRETVMDLPEAIIEPRVSSAPLNPKELWKYRHLLYYFSFRLIRSRYKGTLLGWPWMIITTLFPCFISTAIFGNFLAVPSGEAPYFLFFLTGMSLWSFFSNSLLGITKSLSGNAKLLTKLYFPRLIVPLASLAPWCIQLLITMLVLAGVAAFYVMTAHRLYLAPAPRWMLAPVFVLLTALFALGIGLWTCVFNSRARDVRLTLRYVLQFWSYVTPIIYPLSLVPEKWKYVLLLNPMTGVIEGFKWSILGYGHVDLNFLWLDTAIITVVLASGLWFFNESQAKFVDNL